ncbi:hypothetical protein [Demequina iriomotensis]|uniref:hypothetical protein n=1 Tax=Demequina iriomotensis TaxID=1536641 RepID=UPI0012E05C18|nr:hypothetical protein [Demequina iriomotensis]
MPRSLLAAMPLPVQRWLRHVPDAPPSWRALLASGIGLAVLMTVLPSSGMDTRWPDATVWEGGSQGYGDLLLFVDAGRTILEGHPGDAYADPAVQTGPLALAWAALLAWVLHVVGAAPGVGFAISAIVVIVPALYGATRWAGRLRPPRWLFATALAVTAGLVAAWQLAALVTFQHPTYVWVPVLWLVAGGFAQRSRTVPAALALVLACGLETWAVLAAPVILLCLPTWPRRAVGAAVSGLGTAALWAPFVLSDRFHMLDFAWSTGRPTVLTLLVPGDGAVTWTTRVAQAAVIVGAGLAAWFATRRRSDAVTVAVVVAAWARLVTDPLTFPYYRLSVLVPTAAFVLAAAAWYLATRSRRAAAGAGIGVVVLALAQAHPVPGPPAVQLILHAAALTALVAAARGIPARLPDSPVSRPGDGLSASVEDAAVR